MFHHVHTQCSKLIICVAQTWDSESGSMVSRSLLGPHAHTFQPRIQGAWLPKMYLLVLCSLLRVVLLKMGTVLVHSIPTRLSGEASSEQLRLSRLYSTLYSLLGSKEPAEAACMPRTGRCHGRGGRKSCSSMHHFPGTADVVGEGGYAYPHTYFSVEQLCPQPALHLRPSDQTPIYLDAFALACDRIASM